MCLSLTEKNIMPTCGNIGEDERKQVIPAEEEAGMERKERMWHRGLVLGAVLVIQLITVWFLARTMFPIWLRVGFAMGVLIGDMFVVAKYEGKL